MFNKLTLHGGVTYNYVKVFDKNINQNDIDYIINNKIHSPVWSDDNISTLNTKTVLLAPFKGNINASNFEEIAGGQVVKRIVYRQKVGSNYLEKVGEFPSSVKKINDYIVSNNSEYIYKVFNISIDEEYQTNISSISSTDIVKAKWNTFSIIGFDKDENQDGYIVDNNNIWLFRFNVENLDKEINLDKSVYLNFTEYPKVYSSKRKNISGSISCMIAKFDKATNTFEDTVEMEEKWIDFCSSNKLKVLKDIKGNMSEVEILSSKMNTETKSNNFYNTLNFSYVQTGNLKDISAYEVVL